MATSIISSNRNGKVYKTSGNGYSVNSTFVLLKSIAKELGATNIDYNVANTGSCYITFTHNSVNYMLRISNHTKRDGSFVAEPVTIESYDVWVNPYDRSLGTETINECEYNIINTESKNNIIKHFNK